MQREMYFNEEQGSPESINNSSGDIASMKTLLPTTFHSKAPWTLDELRAIFALKPENVKSDDDGMGGTRWSFTVEPGQSPMVLIANAKSGSTQAMNMAKRICDMLRLHTCQLYFMEKHSGFRMGLQLFKDIPHTVIVMGGDGSVQWLMGEMDKIAYRDGLRPVIGVLPLGTGNDLARAMGCGGGITTISSIFRILKHIPYDDLSHGVKGLDRWLLTYTPEEDGGEDNKEIVFNNYFSIGVDAKVALKFHQGRRKCGSCYRLQSVNKLWYGIHSMGTMCCNAKVADMCKLVLDESDTPVKIPSSLECLVFVNIPSYAAGTNVWGKHTSGLNKGYDYHPQSSDDGVLEIVGLRGLFHAGLLQLGLGHAVRIGQATTMYLHVMEDVVAQVDGE
eukprot:Ihof_evm9s57 gene=Ihof_evmTU9s57